LEAGALILADNGICAIDEFDKISDSSSLLEVMEQQTVSIAKAGVICQLKCRVGIVASANPTSGCYNKAKTFKDNTKISNAILSRFDLIFLLVDKPDPARDRKLAEHIMKIHNNKRKKKYHVEENIIKTQFNIDQYNQYLSLAEKYNKLC
jgi:DNA helicase MCM8